MISALDDILEDFSLYFRVEKRISERAVKNYCYLVGKFLRWVDTLNPEKRDEMEKLSGKIKIVIALDLDQIPNPELI